MAERIVKVCDRCQAEAVLFNTTNWATVTFQRKRIPENESVTYDLCHKCVTAVQVYVIGAETKAATPRP